MAAVVAAVVLSVVMLSVVMPPRHYEVRCEIIINHRNKTAKDVRLFVDSLAINQGLQNIGIDPSQKQRAIILETSECEIFRVNWV